MTTILAIEHWVPINGFLGYEISNLGTVRSSLRKNVKTLRGEIDEDGYHRVTLVREGKKIKFHTHRLVAVHFVDGHSVIFDYACHKDGVRRNNRASNLKWATQAENIADKITHGTHQIGSRHPRAEIDESIAKEIKRRLTATPRYKGRSTDIARDMGVSIHIVNHIVGGKVWRHA